MMMRPRGFTLIELLVVIAVVALLAAILFPTFAQARRKSYQTACTSNLRQVGLALALYQDDNDEKLMPGHKLPPASTPNQSGYAGWAGLCNVYARAPRLFKCPTDETADYTASGEVYYGLTYFLNLNLVGDAAPEGLPRAALARPAVTVLVAEVTLGVQDTARLQNPAETDSVFANYFTSTDADRNRHQGGRVFLLADGHVRWLRPDRVSVGVPVGSLAPPPYALPTDRLGTAYDATFAPQ